MFPVNWFISISDFTSTIKWANETNDVIVESGKFVPFEVFAEFNLSLGQNIDDIKKEDTEVVLKSDIEKIKYRRATTTYNDVDSTSSSSEGILVLKLSDRKIKFTHNYDDFKKGIKNYIKDYK